MSNTKEEKGTNTMLKMIVMLIFMFLVFIIVATVLAYYNNVFAYDFVICHHGPTNTNNTYPEGTVCDDEMEHLEESEEWEEKGWTHLK